MTSRTRIYGVMAEFETAQQILDATRAAWQRGYREMDAYTPYPVEGLATELGETTSRVPFVILVSGIVGAGIGFFMQYWSMAVAYPLNVGGRPYNSWPVFVPIMFEVMVLIASFAAIFSMLYLNGLPQPHHPVFNVPRFAHASQDRFFLCIEATDPLFDPVETATFLASLGAWGEVVTVPESVASFPDESGAPQLEAAGTAARPDTTVHS
jgi:hypothetical protein